MLMSGDHPKLDGEHAMIRKSFFICSVLSVALVSNCFAQQATDNAKGNQAVQERPSGDMGSILIRGLKKTEGCIDVQTCRWQSGTDPYSGRAAQDNARRVLRV